MLPFSQLLPECHTVRTAEICLQTLVIQWRRKSSQTVCIFSWSLLASVDDGSSKSGFKVASLLLKKVKWKISEWSLEIILLALSCWLYIFEIFLVIVTIKFIWVGRGRGLEGLKLFYFYFRFFFQRCSENVKYFHHTFEIFLIWLSPFKCNWKLRQKIIIIFGFSASRMIFIWRWEHRITCVKHPLPLFLSF